MSLNSRTVILQNGNVPLVLSIPPRDTTHENSNNTVSVNILGFGEYTPGGERRAQRTTFSTFFPSVESPLYKWYLNPLPPIASIELLKLWQYNGDIITLIVPETQKYLECRIESFVEQERDFTNDIYFNITLVEARRFDRKTNTVTGLISRVSRLV